MIGCSASGSGADASVEGRSYFIDLTGEFSTSLLGPLGLLGPPIARLNCLAESSGTTTVSTEGALPAMLSALGHPHG